MALTIMCIGSSITRGVRDGSTDPANVMGGYRYYLWSQFDALGVDVNFIGSQSSGPSDMTDQNHEGRNGWTLHQMRDNVASWFSTSGIPDVVLIEGATNDVAQPPSLGGYTAAETLTHLTGFLTNVASAGPSTTVFVAPSPPYLADATDMLTLAAYNVLAEAECVSRAAAGERVRWVPMALTPDMISDTVHPNETGYLWMSRWWLQALQREYPTLLPSVPTTITTASAARRIGSPWTRSGATTLSLVAARELTALRASLLAKYDIISVAVSDLVGANSYSTYLDGPRATVVLDRGTSTGALSASLTVTTSEGAQVVSFGDGGLQDL